MKNLMIGMLDPEIILITEEYRAASEALVEAASLTKDDPVRQEMISNLQDDFGKILVLDDLIKIEMKKELYDTKHVLSLMKDASILTRRLIKKIKEKLEPLD